MVTGHLLPEAKRDSLGPGPWTFARSLGGWGCKSGSRGGDGGNCSVGVPALSPWHPPPRCCLCPSRPRFAPGVTIEEDNCCGCNAIAIRRHFLDENLTAVDIVYTSCHDAVRGRRAGPTLSPGSLSRELRGSVAVTWAGRDLPGRRGGQWLEETGSLAGKAQGNASGLLRLTSHPPPRCTKPPSMWRWTMTRRRW